MKLKIKYLQILNLFFFIALIYINYLANSLPINGMRTGEVIAEIPSKIVPAGFTFSIWGIIYTSLAVFVGYQFYLLFSKDNNSLFYVHRIGGWFILSSVLNISWLFAWHYQEFGLSLILILLLFITLIIIYNRLDICRKSTTLKVRLIFFLPFSLYLSWILFASIANSSIYFSALKWPGYMITKSLWGVLGLLLVYAIGIIVIVKRKDIVFGVVQIFVLIGILSARLNYDFHDNLLFIVVACFGIWVVGGAVVYGILVLFNDRKRKKVLEKL